MLSAGVDKEYQEGSAQPLHVYSIILSALEGQHA